VLQDLFHFIYFFSFFYVWQWSDIIFSTNLVFSIRPEQSSIEDLVDSPRFWQFQLISYWSQHFFYLEWSFSFWSHLFVVICFQMSQVQPDHLSFLEWDKVQLNSFCHATSCQLVCSQCFFPTCDQVFDSFGN
jgi:hypothetical protein